MVNLNGFYWYKWFAEEGRTMETVHHGVWSTLGGSDYPDCLANYWSIATHPGDVSLGGSQIDHGRH